jgi:potassium channel subfamily K, invertebrate
LTVTLLVIFGYIALGAVMFGMWENWDAMAAAYYCFVTISTIGFGDIVPGAAAKGVKATTDTVKLIVDAVYIIAGMAIISMAFNLIQVSLGSKHVMYSDETVAADERSATVAPLYDHGDI